MPILTCILKKMIDLIDLSRLNSVSREGHILYLAVISHAGRAGIFAGELGRQARKAVLVWMDLHAT